MKFIRNMDDCVVQKLRDPVRKGCGVSDLLRLQPDRTGNTEVWRSAGGHEARIVVADTTNGPKPLPFEPPLGLLEARDVHDEEGEEQEHGQTHSAEHRQGDHGNHQEADVDHEQDLAPARLHDFVELHIVHVLATRGVVDGGNGEVVVAAVGVPDAHRVPLGGAEVVVDDVNRLDGAVRGTDVDPLILGGVDVDGTHDHVGPGVDQRAAAGNDVARGGFDYHTGDVMEAEAPEQADPELRGIR